MLQDISNLLLDLQSCLRMHNSSYEDLLHIVWPRGSNSHYAARGNKETVNDSPYQGSYTHPGPII